MDIRKKISSLKVSSSIGTGCSGPVPAQGDGGFTVPAQGDGGFTIPGRVRKAGGCGTWGYCSVVNGVVLG